VKASTKATVGRDHVRPQGSACRQSTVDRPSIYRTTG